MQVTQAVTHIGLSLGEANDTKVAELDAVAAEYMALCQAYVFHYIANGVPVGHPMPVFVSILSARWHQVAMRQASGIAQSWLSNYDRHQQTYQEALARYQAAVAAGDTTARQPQWHEPNLPTLKVINLQVSAQVAELEPAEDTDFDYWLRVSTLTSGRPIRLPVRLSHYHRKVLANHAPNRSMTFTRRANGWWLTLTITREVPVRTPPDAPVVGVDVGITRFITTSTGQQYGAFSGKLTDRHRRDHIKRQNKAKLRACLEKKGVQVLPSVANPKLGRQTRQEINRAVNQFYADHPDVQVAFEDLSVATMRFKAKRMNAYLRASNLGHLPKQLAWGALKRGQIAQPVNPAYSSQGCSRCQHVTRSNRPNQQTFCCVVCDYRDHADKNAATNLANRFNDVELRACRSKEQVKTLLATRHRAWLSQYGCP